MIPVDLYISCSWWGRTCYASFNGLSQSSVTRKLKSGFEVTDFRVQEKKMKILFLPIPSYNYMFSGSDFL